MATGPRSRLEVEVELCNTCEAKLTDVMLLRTGRNWKRCVVMNVTDKKTQRWPSAIDHSSIQKTTSDPKSSSNRQGKDGDTNVRSRVAAVSCHVGLQASGVTSTVWSTVVFSTLVGIPQLTR